MKNAYFILGLLLLLLGNGSSQATPAAAGDAVMIVKATRITRYGDQIGYLLLIPQDEALSSAKPYPGLLLNHGFGRDYSRHIDNAIHFAAAGMVVMVPNLLETGQFSVIDQTEVNNVADHVRWLIAQSTAPSSPLYEILDSQRIAIAGHSAGGAVSLEATVVLQHEGISPSGLLLWDAVPYMRTYQAAEGLEPLPLLSLRASPNGCNAYGAIGRLTSNIPFPLETILLPRSSHCDFEAPTDVVCELTCGKSTESNQLAVRDLSLDFLRQIFDLPDIQGI